MIYSTSRAALTILGPLAGLTCVMGLFHVGRGKVLSIIHMLTIDYDNDEGFHDVCFD